MTLENPPDSLVYCETLPELPLSYSTELRDLVLQCYTINKSARPKAAELLNACIQHSIWKESCVSPYGTLIASDFDVVLKESWDDCMRAIKLRLNDKPIASQAPCLLEDTLKIMQLEGPGREGKLAIFIAGKTATPIALRIVY